MCSIKKIKLTTLCVLNAIWALTPVLSFACVDTNKVDLQTTSSFTTASIHPQNINLTNANKQQPVRYGVYEIFSPKALDLLNVKAPIQTLATGFKWVEGPVWSEQHKALFFSDIPNHKIYRYTDNEGLQEFIAHSGYSNGLLINNEDELLIMQSRTRQVARLRQTIAQRLNAPSGLQKLSVPSTRLDEDHAFAPGDYQILVNSYQGKRLNSPNDGVLSSNGTLYFTDPPYGLTQQLKDPQKELSFQGVYALGPAGVLTLLDKTLVYPNGIALSVDEKTLYVAASNPDKPAWYRYNLNTKGDVISRELLYEASAQHNPNSGLPDGLKVHKSGVIFATGPDGIWLFDANGNLLAKVHMPSISANLAFDASHSRVFVTAHHQLLSFSLQL